MNLYDTLCAYQSPYWPNYQNLLDPRYSYAHDKIERALPREATDSYLGRLVSLAMTINNYMDYLKPGDLDEYAQVVNLFNASKRIVGRKFNNKVKDQVEEFLNYGLNSAWIEPLLNEYKLGLWTSKKASLKLNETQYLKVIQSLMDNTYPPVVAWFEKNPKGYSPETKYKEEEHEQTTAG